MAALDFELPEQAVSSSLFRGGSVYCVYIYIYMYVHVRVQLYIYIYTHHRVLTPPTPYSSYYSEGAVPLGIILCQAPYEGSCLLETPMSGGAN